MVDAVAMILCGGQSRRMGFDKAMLPWKDTVLLEYQYQRLMLCGLFEHVFIVSKHRRDGSWGDNIILDELPLSSPLVGLKAALTHSPCTHSFVISVDCPFVSYELINKLLSVMGNVDGACAFFKQLHPLIAVYHKHALKGIETMLAQNVLRLQAMKHFCSLVSIQAQEIETMNCNTHKDYAQAIALLGE